MTRCLKSSKTLCLGAVAAALTFALAPAGDAAMIVTDPGTGTLRTNFSGTVGYVFTVGTSDVSITDLGVFDGANGSGGTIGDGLVQQANVAIFLVSDESEVARATVEAGTSGTLVDEFRYISLTTPVTLTAGETYYIGVGLNSGGNAFHDQSDSPTLSADFTGYMARYGSGNSGDARFHNGAVRTGAAYVGPNFQYVPEPASVALLALGGMLMIGRGRRSAE